MPPKYSNLVEVLQESLGVPLAPKHLERATFSPQKLQDLGHDVQTFYSAYRFPRKEVDELRPYFTGKWTGEPKFGRDVEFDPRHYTTGDYRHVPGEAGRMLRDAKKRLLYCHGITFIDPLPYLLDYFRLAPSADLTLARIPAVKELLIEYAHLAPLIESGIVLPVSTPIEGGAIDARDIEQLSDDESALLAAGLPQIDPDLVDLISYEIRKDQVRLRKLEHQADLVLPSSKAVQVLRQMLVVKQQRFASRDVLEPFQVSILGSIPSVNPDAVSTTDIIRMRNDEELFAEWRSLLSGALKRLYEQQGNFTDLDREFADAVREEVLRWRERLTERTRKSSVSAQLVSSVEKVAVGAISGTVGGAITGLALAGPPGALAGSVVGGVIGGVSSPVVESVRDLARALLARPGAVTLRHHFLAIGADDRH